MSRKADHFGGGGGTLLGRRLVSSLLESLWLSLSGSELLLLLPPLLLLLLPLLDESHSLPPSSSGCSESRRTCRSRSLAQIHSRRQYRSSRCVPIHAAEPAQRPARVRQR